MTKQEKTYAIGAAVVAGLVSLWFLRKVTAIPVVAPAVVKWETH